MRDSDGVQFLQWALPRLHLRWPGFRRVRKQVCKRLQRRLNELALSDVVEYRDYLEQNDDEWLVLDALCRVTISRFHRDRGVYRSLQEEILPRLARSEDGPDLRCWCAGCAGGEEPYTLAILWDRELAAQLPGHRLRILATDADPVQLERARRACYPPSALREAPVAWRSESFTLAEGHYVLRQEHRQRVEYRLHDVRSAPPPGKFHLILCRNLAFTYFDRYLQVRVLEQLSSSLIRGGYLVIGSQEELPAGSGGLVQTSEASRIYRH